MVIEKRCGEKVVDRWTGARYGPRCEFVEYAEQAGLRMGFVQAPESVFLADGARRNWDMQETHFPAAVPILATTTRPSTWPITAICCQQRYAPVGTGAGGR